VLRFALLFALSLAAAFPLRAQERDRFRQEPYSFVGMTLAELLNRFGPPRAVYPSRGDEPWQDDVVFEYNEGDFYIFKDRVWQAGVKAAYNIRVGDPKPAALLALGDEARDMGDYALYSLPQSGWPLTLRINFNTGTVSAIFIYRPDF
jgi:hypothetical protein